MAVTVEQVVSRISDWQGKQIEIQPLSGGLTNTNYRVNVDGVGHFVRIPGAKTELLAIDRRNEYHNTKAAAETGVGPKVLYHIPEYDVMVLEFINGQTMSNQRLQAPRHAHPDRPIDQAAAWRAALPDRLQYVPPDRVLSEGL